MNTIHSSRRLYSVLGCTQLDSVEWVELGDDSAPWTPAAPLRCPRHLPGVASLDTAIYVCGGSDDNWTAHSTVEVLDTRCEDSQIYTPATDNIPPCSGPGSGAGWRTCWCPGSSRQSWVTMAGSMSSAAGTATR